MWVKRKESNDWINLDHAYRVEIRDDGLARVYFTSKEMVVMSPRVVYLGKDYVLSSPVGSGLLSMAPWNVAALKHAAKLQYEEEDK